MRWLLVAAWCVALAACGGPAEDDSGLANPASVFCEEQGGTVEIRTDEDGAQQGVCVFEDGSECDEWAFYRGECAPDQDPSAQAHGAANEARDNAPAHG
jgi:putative hemolysin